jgi:hypothetical protein
MDKPSPRHAKLKFEDWLKASLFPPEHYQLLEVVYRQVLMIHPGSKYTYNNDFICQQLTGELSAKDRRAKLNNYVRTWEANTGLRYGFEALHMSGLDRLVATLEQYQSITEKLVTIGKEMGIDCDGKKNLGLIRQLQTAINNNICIDGRPNPRFLKFDKSTHLPLRSDWHHDYFNRALNIGHAVFYDYFHRIETETGRTRQGNPIFRFLAIKIRNEHSDNEEIVNIVTDRLVKSRIDGQISALKKWYSEVRELKLIDDKFYDLLISDNQLLKRVRRARE